MEIVPCVALSSPFKVMRSHLAPITIFPPYYIHNIRNISTSQYFHIFISNTIFLQDNISKYGYNHDIHNISTNITIFPFSPCMALVTIFWGNCTICAHYCPTTTQKVGKNLGNFASNLRSAHPVSPNHCCSGSSKRNIVCWYREIQFSNTEKYSSQIQRNTVLKCREIQFSTQLCLQHSMSSSCFNFSSLPNVVIDWLIDWEYLQVYAACVKVVSAVCGKVCWNNLASQVGICQR